MKINFLALLLVLFSITGNLVGSTVLAEHKFNESSQSGRCIVLIENLATAYDQIHEKVLNALDRSKLKSDGQDVKVESYKIEKPDDETLVGKDDFRKIISENDRRRLYYRLTESITENLGAKLKSYDARIKSVLDPQEGFLAKVLAMHEAKYSISVGTYIFKPDRVGNSLLYEAREAIKRGVNVRILVDSGGSISLFHAELKALQEFAAKKNAGYVVDPKTGLATNKKAIVETALFNPFTNQGTNVLRNAFRKLYNIFASEDSKLALIDGSVNRRNHSKILAVDLEDPKLAVFITGGRNLDESYYAIPQYDDKTYNDAEQIVRNKPGSIDGENFTDEIANFYNKIYYHLGNKWLSRSIMAVVFGLYDKRIESMQTTHSQIMNREDIAAKYKKMQDDNYLTEGFEDSVSEFYHTADNVLRKHVAGADGGIGLPENADLRNPHTSTPSLINE